MTSRHTLFICFSAWLGMQTSVAQVQSVVEDAIKERMAVGGLEHSVAELMDDARGVVFGPQSVYLLRNMQSVQQAQLMDKWKKAYPESVMEKAAATMFPQIQTECEALPLQKWQNYLDFLKAPSTHNEYQRISSVLNDSCEALLLDDLANIMCSGKTPAHTQPEVPASFAQACRDFLMSISFAKNLPTALEDMTVFCLTDNERASKKYDDILAKKVKELQPVREWCAEEGLLRLISALHKAGTDEDLLKRWTEQMETDNLLSQAFANHPINLETVASTSGYFRINVDFDFPVWACCNSINEIEQPKDLLLTLFECNFPGITSKNELERTKILLEDSKTLAHEIDQIVAKQYVDVHFIYLYVDENYVTDMVNSLSDYLTSADIEILKQALESLFQPDNQALTFMNNWVTTTLNRYIENMPNLLKGLDRAKIDYGTMTEYLRTTLPASDGMMDQAYYDTTKEIYDKSGFPKYVQNFLNVYGNEEWNDIAIATQAFNELAPELLASTLQSAVPIETLKRAASTTEIFDKAIACQKRFRKTVSPEQLVRNWISSNKTEFKKWSENSIPAAYPGGETEMLRTISNNVIYPASALENFIDGTVLLRFLIGKDGRVNRIQIVKSLTPECDAAAATAVSQLKPFTPAMLNGKPVPAWFTCPIRYELADTFEDKLVLKKKIESFIQKYENILKSLLYKIRTIDDENARIELESENQKLMNEIERIKTLYEKVKNK